MGEPMQETYPQHAANKVNRYKHQATYDTATIHTIINATPVLHVSFVPDPSIPMPITLPMIGQMGRWEADDQDHCYVHGYVSSRLMNLANSSTQNSNGESEHGLPICIAASHVDGLVLSLTPYSHNYNYRSAVIQGYATVVEDADEKIWAMQLITDSVVRGQWGYARTPPKGAEMQSTRILKVRVSGASGKVRVGGPEDERGDLRNDEVVDSVWTGVVPVYEKFGEPVAGPYNRVKGVPEHVKQFVKEENERREEYAEKVARMDPPPKRVKKTED